jgi:hypothetical protein
LSKKLEAVAYHEAGHAVAIHLNGGVVKSVSIIRGRDTSGRAQEAPTGEMKKYLSELDSLPSRQLSTRRLFSEIVKLNKKAPLINWLDETEQRLAGEAAEVLLGYKKSPDWSGTGLDDWLFAHKSLFNLLDLPYDALQPVEILVPAAIESRTESKCPYEWELLDLYFAFLFRRVSIKLKHNWSLVGALATALIESKQLSGKEVRAIIIEHTKQRAVVLAVRKVSRNRVRA